MTLASEDPVKKEKQIRMEEELCAKAIKKKEQMALYRSAKRAKHFAVMQARRDAKKKAAQQPKKKSTRRAKKLN